MKKYRAFGFDIHSELEIPEFLAGDGPPDFEIFLDNTPDTLENPTFSALRFQTSANEFLLTVDGVARYYVQNGKKISIERLNNASDNSVRLFLLGSAFGALFIQRDLLPMHASSVCVDGKAVLFTGRSGIGKSTMAAALRKKGYKTISDDITLVSIDHEGNARAVAGYPQIKLWEDTIAELGDTHDSLERVRDDISKYKIDITDHFFRDEPVGIGAIYILSTSQEAGFTRTDLKSMTKFMTLINNTFRPGFVKGSGKKGLNFQQVSVLAKTTRVVKAVRQNDVFTADAFADFILEDLQGG